MLETISPYLMFILPSGGVLCGLLIGLLVQKKLYMARIGSAKQQARQILDAANTKAGIVKEEAETTKEEALAWVNQQKASVREALESELAQKKAEFDAKVSILAQQEVRIAEKEKDLSEQQRFLVDKEHTLQRTMSELSKTNNKQLENLERKRREIEELEIEADGYRTQINGLSNDLESTRLELADLKEGYDRKVDELGDQLVQKEWQTENLEADAIQSRDAIAKLKDEIAIFNQAARDTEERIRSLESERDALQTQLQSVAQVAEKTARKTAREKIELETTISGCQETVNRLNEEQKKKQARISFLEGEIKSVRKEFSQKTKDFEKEVKKKDRMIKGLRSTQTDTPGSSLGTKLTNSL